MNTTDGLSRKDRLERVTALRAPAVIDNRLGSLLRQSLSIASFLKYYTVDSALQPQEDGYFRQLLADIEAKGLIDATGESFVSDGNLEPAQAVLLSFLENLRQTTALFNERWKTYPHWYLQEVLQVRPLPMAGDNVWVSFENNDDEPLTIPQGTRFKIDREDNVTYYYRSAETVHVHNTIVRKVFLLTIARTKSASPDVPVRSSLHISAFKKEEHLLTGEIKHMPDAGVRISSPMLLLREGIRSVQVTFYAARDTLAGKNRGTVKSSLFLANIFNLFISTTEGWSPIENYSASEVEDGNGLLVEFELPDSFPPTVPGDPEIHAFSSSYPAIDFRLNFNLLDYNDAFIHDFLLGKIRLNTKVRNISNVLVYNELGKIDNSKPFAPFGINTEKGAWFTIGNYEMNIKKTKTVDVNFYWEQLPKHPLGMSGHYAEYQKGITNHSFIVSTRYLSDFQWQPTRGVHRFPLFASANQLGGGDSLVNAPLARRSSINAVDVEKMPVISQPEEAYEYSLQAREGFLNFTLIQPDIGFGEQVYRRIFTEQMMRNARKKQKYPTILPPVQPVVERITLDYEAEETIDLRAYDAANESTVIPIVPLGFTYLDTHRAKAPIKLVPPWEERSLLIAMENVKAGALIDLFFEFYPEEHGDVWRNALYDQRNRIKDIAFYIGNPHYWLKMPFDFIQKDETIALMINGRVRIRLPDRLEQALFDNQGLLWVRISYEEVSAISFPKLKAVYPNAAKLEMALENDPEEKIVLNRNDGTLMPEGTIPGLSGIRRITPFFGGSQEETKEAMLLRISEYTTHKGRAVTPRDYERLVLQGFPDVAKVKCIVNRDARQKRNIVSIVVIPKNTGADRNWFRPLASPNLLFDIERHLQGLASAYVSKVNVINPVYEEVMIRCAMTKKRYLSTKRKALLIHLVNSFIAPWQQLNGLPVFGHSIDLKAIHDAIVKEFAAEITFSDFSAIRIEKRGKTFSLLEHNYIRAGQVAERTIYPSAPHALFVPTEKHIFHMEGEDQEGELFGIHDMEIGKTFIIGKTKTSDYGGTQ